eukprot:CAMPEP_0174235310 /NCGR_PEP_ID=MMETSP0417-20130205/4797_1 /TAXON_ID=242541 /ORGANISM="Mayorella sp, Strain BSH-02190019" /LENGTH=1313 /DNA_ID=CAMNT_0015313797 /DNA_START=38 /DNA_END=3979 /DNA_ORIENTATION=+
MGDASLMDAQRRIAAGLINDSREFRSQLSIRGYASLYTSPFTKRGLFCDTAVLLCSIAALVFFMLETYQQGNSPIALNWTFFGIFVTDFLLHLFTASSRIEFLFEPAAIADLVTTISIAAGLNLNFLRLVRIFRSLRKWEQTSLFARFINRVLYEVIKLVLIIVVMIFCAAGVFLLVEQDAHTPPLTYHLSLYFTVVTFSTVGYGDISPNTDLGRLVVIVLIVITIMVLPFQISKLVETWEERPRYTSKADTRSPFVILGGNITDSAVIDFLSDFWHQSHLVPDDADVDLNKRLHRVGYRKHLHITIVSPISPSVVMKNLMTTGAFRKMVSFVHGTIQDAGTLKLAGLGSSKCRAVFLFPDVSPLSSRKSAVADSRTILEALAVRKQCESVPLVLMLISPEYKRYLRHLANVQMIYSIQSLKLSMLARSVVVPGFSTLVTNLASSYRFAGVHQRQLPAWKRDYVAGAANEFLTVDLPEALHGHAWPIVVRTLFAVFHVIPFAVLQGDAADDEQQSTETPPASAGQGQPFSVSLSPLRDRQERAAAAERTTERQEVHILLNPGPEFVLEWPRDVLLLIGNGRGNSLRTAIERLTVDQVVSTPSAALSSSFSLVADPGGLTGATGTQPQPHALHPHAHAEAHQPAQSAQSVQPAQPAQPAPPTHLHQHHQAPATPPTHLHQHQQAQQALERSAIADNSTVWEVIGSTASSAVSREVVERPDATDTVMRHQRVAAPSSRSETQLSSGCSSGDGGSSAAMLRHRYARQARIQQHLARQTSSVHLRPTEQLLQVVLNKSDPRIKKARQSDQAFIQKALVVEHLPGYVTNHVLILACRIEPMELLLLLRPLRSSLLAQNLPVVVLSSRLPMTRFWENESDLQDLYLISGVPQQREALIRAGIDRASRALILSSRASQFVDGTDWQVVLTELAVTTLRCKSFYTVTEVPISKDIQFLQLEEEGHHSSMHVTTSFAAGRTWSALACHRFLSQAFYNARLFHVLHRLIPGSNPREGSVGAHFSRFAGSHLCIRTLPSWLTSSAHTSQGPAADRRTPVSEQIGFCELFAQLLESDGSLLIGVYRSCDRDAPPYVLTAPWFDADQFVPLYPTDLLYIFSPPSNYKGGIMGEMRDDAGISSSQMVLPDVPDGVELPDAMCLAISDSSDSPASSRSASTSRGRKSTASTRPHPTCAAAAAADSTSSSSRPFASSPQLLEVVPKPRPGARQYQVVVDPVVSRSVASTDSGQQHQRDPVAKDEEEAARTSLSRDTRGSDSSSDSNSSSGSESDEDGETDPSCPDEHEPLVRASAPDEDDDYDVNSEII